MSGCSLFPSNSSNSGNEDNNSQEQGGSGSESGGGNEQGGGGSSGGGGSTDTTVHVSSVSLNKSSLSLEEMKREVLTFTIFPENATDKTVEWSTSDGTVASVIDGTIYANNPGTATITVSTNDGGKTASCDVTVKAKQIEVETITRSVCFDDKKPSSGDGYTITEPVAIDANITAAFAKGEGTNDPVIWKNPKKSSEYDARLYTGNTLVISSSTSNIRNIEFTFGRDDSSSVTLVSSDELFSGSTWAGTSKEVTFTVTGSGQRRINIISVQYEGAEAIPEDINLGVKSIAEVKEYIANNPVDKNAFGNGVNEHVMVTIKGFALAKINLEKAKEAYGLNVSEFGKVIMADSTGYIGVASKISGDGTTLFGKVGSYACTDTARYIVTGYLSEYLGHPEILVTSFTWDQKLNVTWSPSVISEATVNIEGFYSRAANTYYNCAGHAYGSVLTLNKLKLYYSESDGQGKRYYNFTDGVKNIRVNAFNLTSISEGKNYDITGIISIKNLSPIIVAFEIKQSEDQHEIAFNYNAEGVAQDITIANLKQIHGSQDDVDTRTTKFPEVINAYGQVFKTTGYLTAVEEGGKYYIGISDSYIERRELINGKDNAMANYGISLIKNKNFWDTDENELYKYNQLFDEYVLEDNPITVYYIVRQQRYQSGKPMWEILLLPDFLNSLQAE